MAGLDHSTFQYDKKLVTDTALFPRSSRVVSHEIDCVLGKNRLQVPPRRVLPPKRWKVRQMDQHASPFYQGIDFDVSWP